MDGLDLVVAQWAKEKPDLDCETMALIGRMLRLTKHYESKIAQCHKSFNLKSGEFDVLATLLRSGEPYCLTPSLLISSMMLTSGAMTNRLDRLEMRGLIERIHSKQDRRSVSVALTEQGKELINRALDEHVKVQHTLVAALSKSDRLELNGMLRSLLGQFE